MQERYLQNNGFATRVKMENTCQVEPMPDQNILVATAITFQFILNLKTKIKS